MTTTKKEKYNLETMGIDEMPFESTRVVSESKYLALFSSLKQGQRLYCHPEAAARISSGLRKWLMKHRGCKNPRVTAKTRCEDGKGGVWWLGERPEKTASPFDGLASGKKKGK